MQCCAATPAAVSPVHRHAVGRDTSARHRHHRRNRRQTANARLATRASSSTSSSTYSTSSSSPAVISERTRRLLQGIESRGAATGEQASGAGGGNTPKALERADAVWSTIRNMQTAGPAPAPFVVESNERMGASAYDFDVCVCGGTLGILVAAALQARWQRVLVIERGAP